MKLLASFVFCVAILLIGGRTPIADGRLIHNDRCRSCHANEGDGSPAISEALSVPVEELREETLHAVAPAGGNAAQLDESRMPAQDVLETTEASDLFSFVRGLAKPGD